MFVYMYVYNWEIVWIPPARFFYTQKNIFRSIYIYVYDIEIFFWLESACRSSINYAGVHLNRIHY